MNRSRSLIALLAAAVVTGTIGVGATLAGGEPQWLKALHARSEALNQKHGLGEYARSKAARTRQAWQRALMVRSDALNREYGLGLYARTPSGRGACLAPCADDPQRRHEPPVPARRVRAGAVNPSSNVPCERGRLRAASPLRG